MPHTYLLFDFAQDEEKAQQARHKLESWKQAFRLDKKLLYKMERKGSAAPMPESEAKPPAPTKGKGKAKGATKEEVKGGASAEALNQEIKLLIRLDFSGHEKLSAQRWVQRIPAEEPFQGATPKVVKPGDETFEATEKQFDELT